jgi:hypothetical protein
MNRVQFLMQGLEISEIQASLVNELIAEVPNEELKNFLVFRMSFIEQYKSKELITKQALFEYQKLQTQKRLQAGEKLFKDAQEVKTHIEMFYKGKDVGYGIASYYDYVVIGLNDDCELINKYSTTESGNYRKLNSVESAKVYEWLFENQHRIGVVKIVPYFDTETLQIAPVEKDDVIDGKVLNLIKGGNKK